MNGEDREPRVEPRGSHDAWDELATGWALHGLGPDDEARFLEHLPECPRCQTTIAEVTEITAELAGAVPQYEPPAELRERILVAAEQSGPTGAEPGPAGSADHDDVHSALLGTVPAEPDAPVVPIGAARRSRWRTAVATVAAAAAAVLVAVVLVWNGHLRDDRDTARDQLADQQAIVSALAEPGPVQVTAMRPSGNSDAVAVLLLRDERVQVVPTDLAPNHADQSYVLWGQTAPDQPMVGLGVFDVNDATTVSSIDRAPAAYSTYAISLEQGHSIPPEPSTPVALGTVSR